MNKRLKTSPQSWRPQAPSAKLSPPKILVPAAPSPFSPIWRAGTVGVALLLGGYLIETHPTHYHTLAGVALWAVAVSLSLAWFPRVPGAGIFPILRAPETEGSGEWSMWKITLAGGGALAALGASSYFLGKAVGFFLFSLLALGWCLTILEDRLPRALGDKPLEPAQSHRASLPWAVLVVLLFGSFFLFYGWDLFIKAYNADSVKSLEVARDCIVGITTPYRDWAAGMPIFPYWLMGLFFKAVGCSYQKGDLFTALLNLAGYLFFYGFVRFYLPKAPALAATLLFSASHWVLYPAREINGARGMLLPFECATLYFFTRALEKGQARDYALFGAFLASMLLVALQGWIFLFLFILAMAGLWFLRRPEFLRQKKSWIFAWSVAFLFYLPMFLYYQHSANPWCFPITEFNGKSAWHGQKFFIPWDNFRCAIQMFNISSRENLNELLPLLSPWEGLFFLAGLGWCLWRFFKPSSLFILLGLLGGLSPAYITDANIILRSMAAAPFVFLLVGIGLDRLMMVLAAPLGHRGVALRFLLGGVFLALAVGWQYDIFFNHLPRFADSYWNPCGSGRNYLFGTITAKHLEGWDTYVDLLDGTFQHPEDNFFYSRSDMKNGQRFIFHTDLSSLPLKSIPQKGALILLPDQVGKEFQGWISYYYPAVQEKDILNPFGDVEYRLWEITPDQIQKALALPPGPPPGDMVLSWFDAQSRPLGRWTIPTLSANVLNREWSFESPDNTLLRMDKAAYFTVRGTLKNPAGKVLALEANGRVDGFIGGSKILLDGRDPSNRLEIPQVSKNPAPFQIRYVPPKEGGFKLNLLEKTPMGWDMIPSSELELLGNAK